mgnify:CR=1 FL=1
MNYHDEANVKKGAAILLNLQQGDRAGSAGSEVRNLKTHFRIGRNRVVHAVDGVSLNIAENEILGLVGESGCGKSTLLHMLAGLLLPSEGCVRIHGHQVSKPSAKWNMMFQKPSLYPWMNVRENAELGRHEYLHARKEDAQCLHPLSS